MKSYCILHGDLISGFHFSFAFDRSKLDLRGRRKYHYFTFQLREITLHVVKEVKGNNSKHQKKRDTGNSKSKFQQAIVKEIPKSLQVEHLFILFLRFRL